MRARGAKLHTPLHTTQPISNEIWSFNKLLTSAYFACVFRPIAAQQNPQLPHRAHQWHEYRARMSERAHFAGVHTSRKLHLRAASHRMMCVSPLLLPLDCGVKTTGPWFSRCDRHQYNICILLCALDVYQNTRTIYVPIFELLLLYRPDLLYIYVMYGYAV